MGYRYIESSLNLRGRSTLGTSCHYLNFTIDCNYNKYGFSITMVQGISGSVLDSSRCNFYPHTNIVYTIQNFERFYLLQISNKWVSSLEESHLQALSEPGVNLSAHRAPIAPVGGTKPACQWGNKNRWRLAIRPSQCMARRW